jgi:hypothetical protein
MENVQRRSTHHSIQLPPAGTSPKALRTGKGRPGIDHPKIGEQSVEHVEQDAEHDPGKILKLTPPTRLCE